MRIGDWNSHVSSLSRLSRLLVFLSSIALGIALLSLGSAGAADQAGILLLIFLQPLVFLYWFYWYVALTFLYTPCFLYIFLSSDFTPTNLSLHLSFHHSFHSLSNQPTTRRTRRQYASLDMVLKMFMVGFWVSTFQAVNFFLTKFPCPLLAFYFLSDSNFTPTISLSIPLPSQTNLPGYS